MKALKAKFVKNVPRDTQILARSQNDECRVYELSEPFEYTPGKKTRFVIVAAINGFRGPYTHIYPARKFGPFVWILDWAELPGSLKGELDPEEALRCAGWDVV